MPNWCFNELIIKGNKPVIDRLKNQVGKPTRIPHTDLMTKEQTFAEDKNPIFSFWNIVKPTNLAAYAAVSDISSMSDPDNWYGWNNRNWGTKWDACQVDIKLEDDESITYYFETAWAPPYPVIEKLSEQYPQLEMQLHYNEEQGWGGVMSFDHGTAEIQDQYDYTCWECSRHYSGEYESKCSECGYDYDA
jgi:hypothetical protein